jgi:hypothetical protein
MTASAPGEDMTDARVPIPDPTLMRRAGNRMILALIAILILVTPFTIWGVVLLAAAELPGLPLAVGGVVLAIAATATTVATLQIRRTLSDGTVTRDSLLRARRVATRARAASLMTLLALLLFGLIRLLAGEWWSLLGAIMTGVALYFFARGARTVIQAQSRSLTTTDTN